MFYFYTRSKHSKTLKFWRFQRVIKIGAFASNALEDYLLSRHDWLKPAMKKTEFHFLKGHNKCKGIYETKYSRMNQVKFVE